jgi:hypothetical protein
MMRPFRGTYANETVFLTTVHNARWPESDLLVETRVVRGNPTAFVLMSDGCEKSAFECQVFDEKTGRYRDPNRPYAPWLEPKVDFANTAARSGQPFPRANEVLADYLANGGRRLQQESDDKTLVLGVRIGEPTAVHTEVFGSVTEADDEPES